MKRLLFLCSCFVLFKLANAQAEGIKGVDSNSAVLYIYRPGGGYDKPNSKSYIITANGKEIATIKHGQKQAVRIDARDSVLLSTSRKTKDPLTLNLKGGKSYFIRCFYHTDYFWAGPQLILMPEDRGRFEYGNYERIIAETKEKQKRERREELKKDNIYN